MRENDTTPKTPSLSAIKGSRLNLKFLIEFKLRSVPHQKENSCQKVKFSEAFVIVKGAL